MTWNSLRHFHREPAVIAAWRRVFGPLLRWLTPRRRRVLLATAALWVAVRHPLKELAKNRDLLGVPPDLAVAGPVVFGLFVFVWLAYVAANRFADFPSFVRRHPQICLHSILWALLAWLWTLPPSNAVVRAIVFGYAIVLPFVLWRIGYMLFTAQRGKMKGTRFVDHLFYIYPIWRGTDTPYGKGFDYLEANEARDETELARSQLAGVKLFLLAGVWSFAKYLLDAVVFDEEQFFGFALQLSPPVPHVGKLIAHPGDYPRWLSWIALYVDLLSNVLTLAIKGHVIIGWLRLFGFNVFRNTYKPLLAETVVEFWNRYYYYFKELLVNFFFYPTFARYFRRQPRARIFAAVFAAAFAGNIYYHWLELHWAQVTRDFHGMWSALQSRFFYCFLLALGISISMLRQQRGGIRSPRPFFRRSGAIFGVWTFFSVIHIWAREHPAGFSARLKFFLSLIGLD